MPGARSELKVSASDALEFEAIQSSSPKSLGMGKAAIFVIVSAVLIVICWLFVGDTVLRLFTGKDNVIPLIAAPVEPIKVRPKKPGGLQVPNRDKLVYERIQSGTAASSSDIVERLLPKSEEPLPKPISRTSELLKIPTGDKKRSVRENSEGPKTSPEAGVPSVAEVRSVKPPPPLSITPKMKSVEMSVDRNPKETPLSLKKQMSPRMQPKQALNQTSQSTSSLSKQTHTSSNSSVSSGTQLNSVAVAPKRKLSKVRPLSPDGSYKVQLAAARTPEKVRSEWDRLRRKHLDLLGNLGLTVTKANLGLKKGVFYRLRVGPLSNEQSARALCKKLSKRKMGCLVIKPTN